MIITWLTNEEYCKAVRGKSNPTKTELELVERLEKLQDEYESLERYCEDV